MRVVALHADVIVFISRVWQTTCTALRSGEEGFVIDSPIYPDELEAVQGVLDQAAFPVSGLLATHGDWDHLLGRLIFPEAPLGTAQSTSKRLDRRPGEAQRALREFDEEHYVQRPRPLALAGIQVLPVPGRLSLGLEQELELHPAEGHTGEGMAVVVPSARLLIAGDYLSPVEIPMISPGGSTEGYRETLGRLGPLLAGVDTVVPGHGNPISAGEASAILDEDLAYLTALAEEGGGAAVPASRRNPVQRAIHQRNAALAAGGGAEES